QSRPLGQSVVKVQMQVPPGPQLKPSGHMDESVQGTGMRGSGVQRPAMHSSPSAHTLSNSQNAPELVGWMHAPPRHSPGAGQGLQSVPSHGGGGFGSGTQRGTLITAAHTKALGQSSSLAHSGVRGAASGRLTAPSGTSVPPSVGVIP